jgi:hypothetical protein
MRHAQLRHLFLTLAAAAVPAQLSVTACGGTVLESERQEDNAGGAGANPGAPPVFVGTGGVPVYMGVPTYMGTGGVPNYMGTGGVPPMYVGSGGTGSVPIYVGTGGAPPHPPVVDAGRVSDAEPPGVDAGHEPPADDGGCDDAGGPRPSGCGRRPPGLECAPAFTGGELCIYFQEMARLEAASVPAFRRLGHELRVHGAPGALLRAARRAARDEVVHTRLGRALAERFGGRYVPPRIAPRPMRSVEELARDNAVEGCVRETFGAMIATWQAHAASDPVVRRIMRRVAIDETRHAALAIRVARWAERRLSCDARRRVNDARRATAAAVLRELDWEPSQALVSVAGIPTREEAKRLARTMTAALWA